jgi:DNA polymerase-3 subunit epsilon
MYAIVDIETTGGSASRSRITEIAIFIYDGKEIIEEFQTLINPCKEIPWNIVRLTGIDNEMVADVPLFSDVADKIDQLTKDCVFVAHNVNFDYNFIRAEFERVGRSYKRKKLCTVRLSRRLLPGKHSYSLGRLCASENIPLKDRHRAAGDARATVMLFEKLLEVDQDDFIAKSLNPLSLEALLPPNLHKSDFLGLPNAQGLYYFKDQKQRIVYIGKAKNIKKRVHSHFSGNSNTRSKFYFVKNIYHVDFKLVPNNLLLDLIEASEIKKYWPRYNKSMKRVTLNYGLFQYTDRNGYYRLNIGRCGKYDKPLKSFKSQRQIKEFLRELVIDYKLCPRLAGLQPLSSGKCNYVEDIACNGACEQEESSENYNARLSKAIIEKVRHQATFMIKENNGSGEEKAIVLIENGRYKGYGVVAPETRLDNLEKIKSVLVSAYDDQDMSILVHAYLEKAREENIIYL